MKRTLLLLATLLLVMGCKFEANTIGRLDPDASGFSEVEYLPNLGGIGPYNYTRTLGDTPRDVYVVLSNTSSNFYYPLANYLTLANTQGLAPSNALIRGANLPSNDAVLRNHPLVEAFNANPPARIPAVGGATFQQAPPAPQLAVIGDTYSFMNSATWDLIPSTLRAQTTDGTLTLRVWVANEAWGNCWKAHCMNQTMVDAYASAFLKAGADNDVYDWASNLFGAPWGAHGFGNLMASTAANTIDILFFDIDGDNSANGGVIGFFWAKDNYLVANQANSNQRLMFYMDSVMAAHPDGSSWEITDYWGQTSISTLAHEFQHMVHFYQKGVLQNTTSQTWLNEMCSAMAEDFLADKLNIQGPRGVIGTDYSPGNPNNAYGRLPTFNYYNDINVFSWNAELKDYSKVYALGAYLARNYGGAQLIRNIVQNPSGDQNAILNSINALGYRQPDSSLINTSYLFHGWGVAVLNSNFTNQQIPYRYNSATSFDSTWGSITYRLGAINLYYYSDQPYLYHPPDLSWAMLFGNSNLYIKAASRQSGTFGATFNLPAGVAATVIVKEAL